MAPSQLLDEVVMRDRAAILADATVLDVLPPITGGCLVTASVRLACSWTRIGFPVKAMSQIFTRSRSTAWSTNCFPLMPKYLWCAQIPTQTLACTR
jgi:hypothetical protein